MSVQAKLEVVSRKHIVHLTGFGAYSSTCYKGTDNCLKIVFFWHWQAELILPSDPTNMEPPNCSRRDKHTFTSMLY